MRKLTLKISSSLVNARGHEEVICQRFQDVKPEDVPAIRKLAHVAVDDILALLTTPQPAPRSHD